MLKKFAALFLALGVVAMVMAGCGKSDDKAKDGNKDSSKGFVPKELTIGFVPSQNAETLEAKAKPLAELLEKEIGIPVKVQVTTDYNGVVEAMGSKQLDLGFLPPTDYVLAHEKGYADVLLQALRNGVDPETGKQTDELVDYYYSGVLVRTDSGINSIKDLKGKRIGYQAPTSSAGYVWPAVEMKEKGVDAQKDVKYVQLQGHDKGVQGVLSKDIDAAAVFVDARNIVEKEYPDVYKNTKYLFLTDKIPNDTISVRPDMDQAWKDKIADAFVKIGEDEKGKEIIKAIYSHVGYKKSQDSNFDVVREYTKKIAEVGK
ncbi:phosphate/phosphite/phosphonate ABC transporter substrate-binding protein [Heyndrickxia vini]|uniref:Phosphate/phosphite/phosphonate ABC transporter substrate-binding protein n=1 Tax=Heyndrickxia vini TaxID=1476025 RepID=A0ABX7E0M6_9BACI|nr:phosphate/phosphite/phosphonate ABC transporter substrate-binding protein [Heyndrickxia vini]QQZ09288.1 phosphate/phosphite/phosphonate ABC transporter substrate-binding protein [Heyndrickxia vini]